MNLSGSIHDANPTSGGHRDELEDESDEVSIVIHQTQTRSESPPRAAVTTEVADQRDADDDAGGSNIPPPIANPTRIIRVPSTTTKVKKLFDAPTQPNVSEKELKAITLRNTMRNEVYLCAIDTQIVRKLGPRPPSPSSKIRTTADREEEEKKVAREARARRRAHGSEAESVDENPRVERIEFARGAGEDEDYDTATRLLKRPKTSEGPERTVVWDRGLTVIRDDGEPKPSSRETPKGPLLRSCMRASEVRPLVALRRN